MKISELDLTEIHKKIIEDYDEYIFCGSISNWMWGMSDRKVKDIDIAVLPDSNSNLFINNLTYLMSEGIECVFDFGTFNLDVFVISDKMYKDHQIIKLPSGLELRFLHPKHNIFFKRRYVAHCYTQLNKLKTEGKGKKNLQVQYYLKTAHKHVKDIIEYEQKFLNL